MGKLKILILSFVVGFGVAITYYIFESAVHGSINIVWNNWLNTDENRLLIVPLMIVISLVYFGLQHLLDPKSEHQEADGLGNVQHSTIANYLKVLAIGFFSLLAGTSLGPEAILIPASIILGSYIGSAASKNNKHVTKLLGAVGIAAIFAAFFNSFFVGLLAIFLVTKKAKMRITDELVLSIAVASFSTILTLKWLSSDSYVSLPSYNWGVSLTTVLLLLILVLFGYIAIYVMGGFNYIIRRLENRVDKYNWYIHAVIASLGLSILYLLGGPLVEFTGNDNIQPLLQQASTLGTIGLVQIVIIKLAAMSWSRMFGYRGGLIFPTIFVAAGLIAIMQVYVNDLNLIYGLIAVMVGAFIANSKSELLF